MFGQTQYLHAFLLKYQNTIMQQSIGKVNGAKNKCKKKKKKSIPTENYFEKSRLKLKKYGDL